jgi:multidrug efflux pump subunit AcrA (membrane-fusion protein)
MRRRLWIANGTLAVALVAAATTAVHAIGDPGSGSTSTARTSTVSRGTVTATVTASGNLAANQSVGINFGSSGTVTDISVSVGQQVSQGQALAKIDDTKARESLASAQAGLAQAEGAYQTATQGESDQQKARDQKQVDGAQVSLENARTNLTDNQAINAQKVQAAQNQLTTDSNQQNADCSGSGASSTQCAQDRQKVAQDQQTLQSTQLQAQQSNDQAQGQVNSAQASLDQANATATVDAAPARPGAVASAQAQVDSANAQVAQAQTTLDQTVLKAPVAGTVVSISGKVGADSSSTSGSSGSTGSTGSASSGSSGSASSATSSSSASSSSSTSGFMVIGDLSQLQVTSMVAEADARKVAVGQSATATFSALNESASGRVAAVDLQQTVSNNVVEYGVTVTLDNPPSGLKLGQTASVAVTTGSRANVLRLATSAITRAGGLSTVSLRKDGKTTVQPVQTGLAGDTYTEITSGLSAGDVVVLPTSGGSTGGFTFPASGSGIPGGGVGAGRAGAGG